MIDELETALAEGRRLPFTGHLLVDEERLLDIIDRMRVAVPEELKQARRIIGEQEQLLSDAQSRVQEVLEERGLLAAVDAERARLIAAAQDEADGIRKDADAYARQVLEDLEQRLARWTTTVQNGLKELRAE